MKSLDELTNNIALRSFDAIKIILSEELELFKNEGLKANDIMNVIINFISAIDINILGLAKRIFEETTGRRIDTNKLIESYLGSLDSKIAELELHFKKKKMN